MLVRGKKTAGNMKRSKRSFTTALGGVLLALDIICLYLAQVVPAVELVFYLLTSLCICIMVAETGLGGGLLVFVAGALLGVLLVPGKLGILPYVFFYGIFPLIKCLAERIHHSFASHAVKFGFFAVVMVIAWRFFRSLFFANIDLPGQGAAALILFGVVMYICYDYILSGVIRLYRKKIRREKEIHLS